MPRSDGSLGARVLVLELDSARQAARLAAAPDPRVAVKEFVGMLRAALLVSERILVTDSMVLDGALFAQLSPSDLARTLDVPVADLPFTVICSEPTLARSLRRRRRDRGFRWQLDELIDADARDRHWKAWADLDHLLVTEPYREFASFGEPDEAWRASLSEPARRHLATMSRERRRSAALQLAERARSAHPDDAGLAEVYDWWETAYLVAIADSVGADWLRFDPPPGAHDGMSRNARRGRRRLHVADEVIERTTTMTPAAFGVVRYLTRDARAAVHAKPTGKRMRDLSYAISTPLQPRSRTVGLVSASLRLVIGLAVIGTTVPFLAELFPASEFVWFAFGVAVLASTPWDAIASLFGALKPRQAVMSIRVRA